MTTADAAAPADVATTAHAPAPKKVSGPEWPLHVILLTIGIVVSIPILLAIFTSFTPLSRINANPNSVWWPEWTLQNYHKAWTATPFGRFMINSFVQTGIITFAQVLFSVMAGYAFANFEFPGKNVLFIFVLGSLMVPFELTFIPSFRMISDLGRIPLLGRFFPFVENISWANTYQGLVLPFLASAFGVFMLRQFFMTIPRDLRDAAKIDGASDWFYLWRVVVPLSRGAISAFTIFAFLSAWNQYLWPLIITNDENMRTAQIGIRFFLVNQERAVDWGAIMAGAVIVMLPTLLVFLVAQKQLVKGIAMTGLKG